MSFTIPTHFTELDSTINFDCGDGHITNAMYYVMIKKDKSVIIGISLLPEPDAKRIAFIKTFSPNYVPGKDYLRAAQVLADTIRHKLLFYDKAYSKQTFNGDNGGAYVRACWKPYLNKYDNKVVFISRTGRGFAEITYLYTEKAKAKIDKYIRKTAGMLRFND